MKQARKRDGSIVEFNSDKITMAVFKAAQSVGGQDIDEAKTVAKLVCERLQKEQDYIPHVEEIQDVIEKALIERGHAKTAKSFILYRARHAQEREQGPSVDKEIPKDEEPFKAGESLYNCVTNDKIDAMFNYKSKLLSLVEKEKVYAYKILYYMLKDMQDRKKIKLHASNNYLGDNELARDIYARKYYVNDFDNAPIETRPEDVFRRVSSFIASIEPDEKRQKEWAVKFYDMFYEGQFYPGGRIVAGAGDLYRLKTLANCFVSLIEEDNIESIYHAAYECARTYSYGGGIGVDVSCLRPKNATVHNASNTSTGAVSFMELYSLTTGLIGQNGRRGALMLTLDVKHPDVMDFIDVKKNPNWVTKQIIEQCKWSGKFTEDQLKVVEQQVRENTQIRFANISLKVSDEFMQSVDEQNKYGTEKILVYKKKTPVTLYSTKQDKNNHFSYGIQSKNIEKYEFYKLFDDVESLNEFLSSEFNTKVSPYDIEDPAKKDIFGDIVVQTSKDFELAIRRSGDYMLYFNSIPAGETRRVVKARDVWDKFVGGNYKTAEPGLIFWSSMTKYSPSNYLGKPISCTNPCGEVPLEDGGACNLGSINLSRFVKDGYTTDAKIDWEGLKEVTQTATRFLDNVISWNHVLNPLEKQRKAAEMTRRIGLGFMGIADMLNQLGLGYDSSQGLKILGDVSKFIADEAYKTSALLAQEKGPIPIFDFEKYSQCPFFKESISKETQELIKSNGIRNVAVLSIAPTGTISNVVLGYRVGDKNYIGVSGGVEPIFSLFYRRRSESFGNKFFNVFHSTVQAYLEQKGLLQRAQNAEKEDDLRGLLPEFFFRTSHHIEPEKRVEIQGVCQKYIDHSISSTVNLPESINPEVISNVYLDAWKKGLKGITIYRDGSRYPILSVAQEMSEFQEVKGHLFEVSFGLQKLVLYGDDVFTLPNGKLSTPYHAGKAGLSDVKIIDITPGIEDGKPVLVKEEGSAEEKAGACKIKFVGGKLIKGCSE